MSTIRATSIQAPVAHPLFRGIVGHLSASTGLELEVTLAGDWRQRQRQLKTGSIGIGWVCGRHYTDDAESDRPTWRLLAAPVMSGSRYGDRAVYFSDLVVRRGSRYRRFEDLEGARWAYNEPTSHSGYGVMLAHLATRNRGVDFFAARREAGCHERAMTLVANGRADCAAIDSTVREHLRLQGRATRGLRAVACLGPSPMPPLVVHRSVPASVRTRLRDGLARLHEAPGARATLNAWGISRFDAVVDRDYDAVRVMTRRSRQIALGRRFHAA